MFVNALKKCPEYLDKLNKLINIKKLDSFEDIDFINDSDAFKLFNLKIFKERSVSVENGESLNETKSKIMQSYQQISFSLENEPSQRLISDSRSTMSSLWSTPMTLKC